MFWSFASETQQILFPFLWSSYPILSFTKLSTLEKVLSEHLFGSIMSWWFWHFCVECSRLSGYWGRIAEVYRFADQSFGWHKFVASHACNVATDRELSTVPAAVSTNPSSEGLCKIRFIHSHSCPRQHKNETFGRRGVLMQSFSWLRRSWILTLLFWRWVGGCWISDGFVSGSPDSRRFCLFLWGGGAGGWAT